MNLFGRSQPARSAAGAETASADEQAIARYRYLLKSAPPETIEEAHAEAFAQLTPEQRRLVLQKLAESAPARERASVEQGGASPEALARVATRAEMRQPGAMERMFGQARGPGLGGLMAGSVLGSIAGTVIGSMIAREFFAGEGVGAMHEGAAQPGEEARYTDADEDIADGGGIDPGGFDEA